MSFRRSMLLVGALCAACGSPPATDFIDCTSSSTENESENEMAIPPWHMWGGLVNVNATTTTPGLNYTTQQQLCRIEYHRPESWRFLFFARVLGSDNHSPAIFDVQFQIIPGVGRASVNVKPFEEYKFKLPIGPLPPGTVMEKWSTSVNGPVRDDTAAVPADPPTPNVVDSFTAQDVQVSVTASVALTVPGDNLQAEIGCLLAPWHHARPDWVLRDFAGEELKGR